jgi:anti-sigma regulatory factor (Ser/Thr protein kinase)
MKSERKFLNRPTSVGQARRFIMDALSGVDGDALDDAAVMVSELASNCLQHAATSFTVEVDRALERVTISVDDAGPGQPSMQTPPSHQPTGRGLRIVDALADSWGVDDHADPIGKRVWFTLSVQPTDQRSRAARQ